MPYRFNCHSQVYDKSTANCKRAGSLTSRQETEETNGSRRKEGDEERDEREGI
jgi:hypothetical protein